MIYISASLLKDYLYCPKKVYYKTNYPEQSIPSAEMIVGSIMHDIVNKAKDIYEASELSAELFKKHNLKSATSYDLVRHACYQYFTQIQTLGILHDDDMLEAGFLLDTDLKNVKLVGRFDRVNTEHGIIVEWKTSAYDATDIDHDVQFILYSEAYEKMYKKKLNKLYYINLVTGGYLEYSRNEVITKELFTNLIPEVAKAMKDNRLSPHGLFKRGVCINCAFNNKCYTDLGID